MVENEVNQTESQQINAQESQREIIPKSNRKEVPRSATNNVHVESSEKPESLKENKSPKDCTYTKQAKKPAFKFVYTKMESGQRSTSQELGHDGSNMKSSSKLGQRSQCKLQSQRSVIASKGQRSRFRGQRSNLRGQGSISRSVEQGAFTERRTLSVLQRIAEEHEARIKEIVLSERKIVEKKLVRFKLENDL